MDDEMNDYDRIAERIKECTSIVWMCQKSLEYDERWGSELVQYALETAVRKMNNTTDWAEGLAKSHRYYEAQKEEGDK